MWKDLFEKYNLSTLHRKQAIFSSIFVMQNRLQTAGEKIQTKISMKQWLLLAMLETCNEECTLTNLGKLMGCSRQNIKKLATALEKKGFIHFFNGDNNSIQISITEKAELYAKEMGQRHEKVLQLLFEDFDENEIKQLFNLYIKLCTGIERVEEYSKEKCES